MKTSKLPQTGNFANEICSGIYIISSLRGGPNFSEGVNILLENKFWGSVSKIWIQLYAFHLYHDRPVHNTVCFVGKLQSTPSHTKSGSIHTVVNRILCMQKNNFNSDFTIDWIHQNSLSHISYVRLDHTLYRIHFQKNEISTTACGIHHSAYCTLSC